MNVKKDMLSMTVSDDGVGISLPDKKGRGLTHMIARVKEMGGSLSISSEGGTSIQVIVKLTPLFTAADCKTDFQKGAEWSAL